MSIDWTALPGMIGGNAAAGDHAIRVQPMPSTCDTGGGEAQPMKCVPKLVTTLKRGAPAPQCEPSGLA